jgi:hypothetical protein
MLCLILGGCGFQSSAAGGGPSDGGADGSAIDTGSGGGSDAGSGSGSDGGSTAATGCFPHWIDGTVSIDPATVQEITELTSAGNDRNPWISDDGLRMYFTRDQGTSNTSDVYFTSRSSTALPFDPPDLLPNLSSSGREGRVWLTPDELSLVESSERSGPMDIHLVTRGQGQGFGSPSRNHLNSVNAVGTHRDDPFLSQGGLRLYLSADSGPAGKQQLLIAMRPNLNADFGAPTLVPGTRDNSSNMTDPTLYQDEQVLVFSAFPQGSTNVDLWYAKRPAVTADFGPPIPIPGIATTGIELDPVLGDNGCELYFSSTRKGDGKLHLFHARITK